MKIKSLLMAVLCVGLGKGAFAAKLLIPMDSAGQANHLRAYGVVYNALTGGTKVQWLLNYNGGSYAMEYSADLATLCNERGVTCHKISNGEYKTIEKKLQEPQSNYGIITMDKAPRVAIYGPSYAEQWDDAAALALDYAQIPYDRIYVDEAIAGKLEMYDWIYVHHEDFTGQYGKFWYGYGNTVWYQQEKKTMEALAQKYGYKKVSQLQLTVAKKIKEFIANGGNMFAMCSGTETLDVALAAEGTDICDSVYDGDPADATAQQKLDFSKCLAFQNFTLEKSKYANIHSSINKDIYATRSSDYFNLQPAFARSEPVAAMLCQNHTMRVNDFRGQTTSFDETSIKPGVTILADRLKVQYSTPATATPYSYAAKYIYGRYGKGAWTFLGGHDPEVANSMIGTPATDMSKFPHSPGYRLILNNVLVPAANKKQVSALSENSKQTSVPEGAVIAGIKMYPNPTSDKLTISAVNKIESITIVNSVGIEVFHGTYSSSSVEVDMKGMVPGIYLLLVNKEYAGRVVKE